MVRATGSTTTLVLMGVAGSGKSAVAAELSTALGWPALDADDLHPEELAPDEPGVRLPVASAWSVSDTAGRLTTLLRLVAVDPA